MLLLHQIPPPSVVDELLENNIIRHGRYGAAVSTTNAATIAELYEWYCGNNICRNWSINSTAIKGGGMWKCIVGKRTAGVGTTIRRRCPALVAAGEL